MDSKNFRSKQGPEAKIQKALIEYLKCRDWYVKSTHGNMYQSGFPDLYCTHAHHGVRWVEVKLPGMKGSKFTPAQLETFPQLRANGTRIWILTAATHAEYQKLFGPDNVDYYLMLARMKM